MKDFDELYTEIEAQISQKKDENLFYNIKKGGGRRLVLYGAGGNCELALYTCLIMNIPVTCVSDSKATGVYEYRNIKYDIISPKQLLVDYLDAFVMITTWQYEREIMDFLVGVGFPCNQIYFFRYPYLRSADTFREKHINGYRWAYNFFNNNNSKRRVLDRIKMYLWGIPVPKDVPYTDGYLTYPGIVLGNNEVYVDGGAYIGDSSEEFISRSNAQGYSHIYAFEPDPENYRTARHNLVKYDNIDIINCGLWSKNENLSLKISKNSDRSGSRMVSQLSKDVINVPVTSLDIFFGNKPLSELPTLIKMDIEGSEKEALVGSTEIIRKSRPRLMVCAYHKPEDIYELPQAIMDIRDDYKFDLWQIGEKFWELVLYAT